jgi:hypothetical protein
VERSIRKDILLGALLRVFVDIVRTATQVSRVVRKDGMFVHLIDEFRSISHLREGREEVGKRVKNLNKAENPGKGD